MFSVPNILLSLTALANIGLTIFVSSTKQRTLTNYYFALFSIFLAFWAIVLIGYSLVVSDIVALYLMKSSYVSALIIGLSFYFFAHSYPQNTILSKPHQTIVITPALLFVIAIFTSETFFTKEIVHKTWGRETILGLPEYLIFLSIFSFCFIGGLVILWIKYLKANKGILRARLLVIAASVTAAGIPGMYFNLIRPSPFFQDFQYIWTGPLFTSIIVGLITYSIFRLQLFNPKLITAEVFTFILWLFTTAQVLDADNVTETIVSGTMLLATIVIGVFLIKSVQREVAAREEVEHLAKKLQKANKRLKELDRMKSEFVSIASHQLRSPLTAIRGYTSMLLEDSFGKIPKKAREAIERIGESSRFMASSVEDYLNVSRIQAGNMKYNLDDFALKPVCEELVDMLRPEATRKGLLLCLKTELDSKSTIHADEGKVRQIIQNLIDNALKYTKEGRINVRVYDTSTPRRIVVDIEDSGIGMSKEDQEQVFAKFERAKNANEVNVTGTGLGLFIAKKMTEDMDGELTVHSDGEGTGSTFTVAFPAA